jgi:hypothetical protein
MSLHVVRSLLCAALLAAAAVPAWADIGRDEAAAVAQRMAGGRVLAVDRAQAGDRPVWRVKIVTPAGEVRVILVDVATGRPS